MRPSRVCRWVLLIAIATVLTSYPLDAGVLRTEVTITDDWPADSFLDMGTISCPGGEIVWLDPATPVCPGSGRIHLRRVMGYGCYDATSEGLPEPRLSGVGYFLVNGNLRADYSGRVWGRWVVVPSDGCDKNDLVDPLVYWKGTWQGRRSMSCDGGLCTWVGDLKLVGKGHGGAIEGIHFKGTETIITFTPMPIPWELIGICGPNPLVPCGPEGEITATIKE